MGRGRAVVLGMVVACGPRIDAGVDGATEGGSSSTGGSSSSSSSSGGDDATVGSSTVAPGSEGSTSTSGASSGDASTGMPEVVELEGLIQICEGCSGPVLLRPCSDLQSSYVLGGELADLWRCSGAYAHVRGYEVTCPGGPCSEEVVLVEEVIEARLCEPTDCGGTTCAALDCGNACEANFDCAEDGEKCVPWAPPGYPYLARRCVEVDADPVGVGEPCSEDAAQPWVDDCDETSACTGVDPTTSVGVCTMLCEDPSNPCPAGELCVETNEQVVAVCRPPCDPFAGACPSGGTCAELNGRVVCVDADELPLLTEYPCEDGIQCDATSFCADENFVPGCVFDYCCTPLCEVLAPACPADSGCEPFWENPPPEYENLGVCLAT